MSAGDGRHGYRYLDISHSSSNNHGVYHSDDKSDENGRGVYRYQDTSYISSCNCEAGFDVDRRVVNRSQTSHYSSHNPGGHGIFSGLSFSYLPVDKKFHGDNIVGYSGNGNERGDISGEYGRRGFRSQEISHSSFHNHGEIIDGDGRGGYRSQTSDCYSHNPGGSGRFLCLSLAYNRVNGIFNGDEGGDSSGDYGRRGFGYLETSHSPFNNRGESE